MVSRQMGHWPKLQAVSTLLLAAAIASALILKGPLSTRAPQKIRGLCVSRHCSNYVLLEDRTCCFIPGIPNKSHDTFPIQTLTFPISPAAHPGASGIPVAHSVSVGLPAPGKFHGSHLPESAMRTIRHAHRVVARVQNTLAVACEWEMFELKMTYTRILCMYIYIYIIYIHIHHMIYAYTHAYAHIYTTHTHTHTPRHRHGHRHSHIHTCTS